MWFYSGVLRKGNFYLGKSLVMQVSLMKELGKGI